MNEPDSGEDDESGELLNKVGKLSAAARRLEERDVDHGQDGLVVRLELLVPSGDDAPEVRLLLPLEDGPARAEAGVAFRRVEHGEQEMDDLKSALTV